MCTIEILKILHVSLTRIQFYSFPEKVLNGIFNDPGCIKFLFPIYTSTYLSLEKYKNAIVKSSLCTLPY